MRRKCAFWALGPRDSPIAAGLAFGLTMGVLLGNVGVSAEAGKQNVSSLGTFVTLESAFFLLQDALAGLMLGALHGWLARDERLLSAI